MRASHWTLAGRRGRPASAGFTLAELILATGLAALVMASLVTVMNSVLNLWTRGETTRQSRQAGQAVAGFLADDLRQLHGSSEGDLLVDWEPFDVERDGTIERLWPRLRFIRDASAREVSRIARRTLADAARAERDRQRAEAGDQAEARDEALREDELLEAAGVTREDLALGQGGARDTSATELLEILYAVVPEGSRGAERYSGVLYRAERVHVAGQLHVLMRDDVFDGKGVPDLGLAREIARGVLWIRPLLATQTTRIASVIRAGEDDADDRATTGWTTGGGLGAAATSWDAWGRNRPDVDVTGWNEPAAGMPRPGERPLLPRRVRVEIEIQRPVDRERAPRLLDTVEEITTTFEVTSGARLARAVGRHVMVAGEWVRVNSVRGDVVTVTRGQRGTTGRTLPADSPLLFGEPVTLELPIPLYEDDWRLEPGRRSR